MRFKFSFKIISYIDSNDLVAEIYYDSFQWAEISAKKDGIAIQLFSHPTEKYWEFSMNDALSALEIAKAKLQN